MTQLTSWISEPTAADMHLAISAATPSHSAHCSEVKHWLEVLEAPALPKKRAPDSTRSTIVPRLARKFAEWRYASLSEPFHSGKQLFTCAPVTAVDAPLAAQDSALLEYQFTHAIDKTRLVDEYVRTAVDEGTAILQVGWDYQESFDGFTPAINQPTLAVLKYDDVMIDPDARGDITAAQYVIVNRHTTIHKLRNTEGYSNLDQLEAQLASNRSFQDNTRNNVVIKDYWGYWDTTGTGQLVPIIVSFYNQVILRIIESPLPFNTLPFVLVQYLPRRNHNYGQPDCYLLEDSQRITGALTRGMVDLLGKSASGQIGYKAGALDAANQLRFQNGQDYIFRADSPPNELMFQHTYPEIPQSALILLERQQQEAESLTGVNAFGAGLSTSSLGNGSAAAATGVISYAAKREQGMLRRLADGLVKIAKLIVQMNRAFILPDGVERITGLPYVPAFSGVDVDIRLSIRTAEADEASSRDLAFLLQTLGSVLGEDTTRKLAARIARLKGLDDIADELLQPSQAPPNPMAEMMQQLEVQQAQLAVELQKVQLQLQQAQLATEASRNAKLRAEADKTNLEFIEEESGTNHARQLEVIAAQAKSNSARDVVKHTLDTGGVL